MTNVEKKIEGLYNTFAFVGEISFNEDKFYTTEVSQSGYKYSKIQFGVKTSDSNLVFVEMMGGFSTVKQNVIKTQTKDKNKIEIAFADRFDQSIVESVADYKKLKVNLTTTDYKDTVSYLSEYDVVEYLKANLRKGVRAVVTGDIVVERYEGKDGKKNTRIKYKPKAIRLAKDDEANKSEVTLSFVFDKEAMELDRLDTEGKIDIMPYLASWDKGLGRNVFVAVPFVIDINSITESFTNVPAEQKDKVKLMVTEMYKKYFKVSGVDCIQTKEEDVLITDNGIIETQWKGEVIRGAVMQQLTMDDLSEDQKLQVMCGIVTLEQIQKEMGNRGGDKVNEIRLTRPTNRFKHDTKEEAVPNKLSIYTEDDFIIPEVGTESKDALFNSATATPTISEASTLDALFGSQA